MHDAEYEVTHARKGKKHGVLTVRDKAGRVFRTQAPAHVADETIIGKQVTIAHVRKTASGVPHAPVFKGVRDYEASALLQNIIAFAAKLSCPI
jgi:hypothetical protein